MSDIKVHGDDTDESVANEQDVWIPTEVKGTEAVHMASTSTKSIDLAKNRECQN